MARVLLVEDNEANADMLTRRLVRHGFEVRLATDGVQAVDMARDEQPDLVLMDISLPRIDGWEATRRIKADAASAHVPIIALTAHAMVADRQRCLDAGCSEFETKPIDLARLLDKMHALLPARTPR
ncbi:MAG: response regulator [Vicinamibacterales bacterium]